MDLPKVIEGVTARIKNSPSEFLGPSPIFRPLDNTSPWGLCAPFMHRDEMGEKDRNMKGWERQENITEESE